MEENVEGLADLPDMCEKGTRGNDLRRNGPFKSGS